MRISKALAKAALIIAVVILGNAALTFLLVPYGSKSEIMWNDYYQEEHIDTIFVGTSLAERAFNPAIVDAAWDCNSYNMCTPVQSLKESLNAVKTAYRDHGITRVVLGTELATFQDEAFLSPSSPFLSEKFRHESPAGILADIREVLRDPIYWDATASLNFLSPWIYNHAESTPEKIAKNIQMKLDATTLYEAAESNEEGWTYYGKGHGNYDVDYAYTRRTVERYTSQHERAEFNAENLEIATRLCEFCRAHNIELIAVNVPEPQAVMLDYGDLYFEQSRQLHRFFTEEHGVAFYDFCFAKPELFPSSDHCFPDTQHMNVYGATLFCNAFSNLINRVNAGADVKDEFYASMDEFRSGVTDITSIALESDVNNGTAVLSASCLTGPSVTPEYSFLVYDQQAAEWVEVRPYSTNPQCTYKGVPGTFVEVRLLARHVNSVEDYERYCDTVVFL